MKPIDSENSSSPIWRRLAARMRVLTGIALSPRTAPSALAVLTELAARRGLTAQAYLDFLDEAAGREERHVLIERLTVGTTWFMREAAGMQALAVALRGELGVGHRVRIWSAGCSTGQEAYGLAATLLEAGLMPQILATDISRAAIRTAQTACYSSHSLRSLSADWRRRYTIPAGPDLVAVHESLTQVVRFSVHNLADAAAPPGGWHSFDAVVCRNVLIYFDRELAVQVVRRMARACRPGGYVLLSAAERPLAWMLDGLEAADSDFDRVLLRAAAAASRAPATPAVERPFAAALPLAPQVSVAPTSTTARLLAEATQAMQAGALPSSLQLLDALLVTEPLTAAAHLVRGLALKRTGAISEAAAALRCARFLFSDEAWLPPYHLALLLDQHGEPEDACEAYRHALAIITAGGASGLPGSDGAEQMLLHTIAEACSARIRALSAEPNR